MSFSLPPIVFVGGGNMASAIAGGLLRQGAPAADITVIEPLAAQAQALRERLGVAALPDAEAARAAAPVAPHARQALHLSVAAGIGTDSLARWLGTPRVIRAMPNTPALAGRGMTGLYARPETSEADRALACRVIDATGEHLWVSEEPLLDAVTALSGSGPAYVFYFLEAMQQAGGQMGLPAADALRLAIATFSGASALAAQSGEPPAALRERVTSKGGTTFAALSALQAAGVDAAFIAAMHAARQRAQELGREFGG